VSVAVVQAERMAERLRFYRSCVARVARGEGVSHDEAQELRRVMHSLGLPAFVLRRDVEAVRKVPGACSHRRRELALNHPQLFIEVEEWVRDHVQAIARRGGRPCPR